MALTPTFIVAMRSRYDLQVLMFSSSTSSDKSSMCDEKRGSPFFAKYSCRSIAGIQEIGRGGRGGGGYEANGEAGAQQGSWG